MKNQSVLIALVVAMLFRNAVPVMDLFVITLTFLLLVKREQMLTISFMALGVAILASFFADSPIGLFPLVLSIALFLFVSLFKKLLDSGIHPVVMGIAFIVLVLVAESMTRVALTTGRFVILPETSLLVLWSSIAFLITTFTASFKQKI